jgi:cytidylate kinase
MPSRVIAIDGPAGSGKSTTAKAVADELGFAHLDSGALYRAVTLAALDAGAELTGQRVVAVAKATPVRLRLRGEDFVTEVAGVDVTEAVRSDRVTERVSEVSAMPDVREWVTAALREAARDHPAGVVMDGRDIGTVVFPDAGLKIYLTASPVERARRRLQQMGRPTDGTSVGRAETEIGARDRADSARAVAPLSQAADAVVLDTSQLSFEQQVAKVVRMARNTFS